MLISFVSSIICTTSCFLYPAYASYKALSLRPEASPDAPAQIERWLQYWAVVGTWTAVEAVVGWTFTWIPFYTMFKALIFFYLSLPQSGGAAYVYHAQLEPFFHEHERDIDAFIANLRTRASVALSDGVGWIWERVRTQIAPALAAQQDDPNRQYPSGPSGPPPTLNDPASGAVQQMYGAFTHFAGQYLPVAVSALTAAASAASSRARGPTPSGAPPTSRHMPPAFGDSTSRTLAHAYSNTNYDPADDVNSHSHVPSHLSGQPGSRTSFASAHNASPSSSSANLRPGAAGAGHAQGSARSSGSSSSEGEGKWGAASGYEEIRREEADGEVVMGKSGGRPSAQRASGSWFSWNPAPAAAGGTGSGVAGSPGRDKTE